MNKLRAPDAAIRSVTTSGPVTKYLVGIAPGIAAEVVRIERPEKTIVCFSTQVGCAIGCAFCASGRSGIKSNLTAGQMILLAGTALSGSPGGKPVLMSAMGEGEPSQNARAVTEALSAMSASGARVAVSTSGPSARLTRALLGHLDDAGLDAKVQYSLHSAVAATRRALMPGSHADPRVILPLLANRSGVELNVVLWDGLNDSRAEAGAIADLLGSSPSTVPWRIKLNRGNRTDGGLEPAGPEAVAAWKRAVRAHGVEPEWYETDGAEIAAACGQLRWREARLAA